MSLKVSSLSYNSQQNTPILKNISFQLDEGDFWVVLGNSGAGKTTLLQLLSGLLSASAGEILYAGKAVQRQHMGLVFQYPEEQFFQSTVDDDISYALRQQGLAAAEIKERVICALACVGLGYEEFKNRSPFELSAGEQRRLAIACVLVNQPHILLLDEPLAGLDAKSTKTVLKWIEQLNTEAKMAVILTTSTLEEVIHLGQKLLLLDRGKQLFCGETNQLLTKPQIITEVGLRLPMLLELGHKLKEMGYAVKQPFTGIDDATDQLSRILRGTK